MLYALASSKEKMMTYKRGGGFAVHTVGIRCSVSCSPPPRTLYVSAFSKRTRDRNLIDSFAYTHIHTNL